jgi:hypothetical protein
MKQNNTSKEEQKQRSRRLYILFGPKNVFLLLHSFFFKNCGGKAAKMAFSIRNSQRVNELVVMATLSG